MSEQNELKHYGMPRRSGRYPWGSGENPQRNKDFLSRVEELKKQGLSEKDIAKGLGLTTSQLRSRKTIAIAEQRKAEYMQAYKLKEKGYSVSEIGRRMGKNESSIRSLLNEEIKKRSEITESTANILKENVLDKKYIDIGPGTELYMGISRTKLKAAIEQLKEEGYKVHYIQVEQLGTGKMTTISVLSAPDTKYKEIKDNLDSIRPIMNYSEDGGRSYLGLEPIQSVNSNRILIKYAEDGGTDKDGVIELRRGVEDISLGKASYAQVRIGVDGTHYLKGMAMYKDDMPDGVDIIFNSNKHNTGNKLDALKEMKNDKDNPFGASVRQKHYISKDGKEKLSALNIVNEEGDWQSWSKSLSSQMLSKQNPELARKQLNLSYLQKKEEYDEIISLTNPTVKKRLLQAFADDCDSAAVHLKAAALPRQASHVILPFTQIKENEIYAPNYKNGESVVLIRYPHGGIFEIPQLRVNNKNPIAKKTLGNAIDAVGINPKTAQRLSGADFDGDSVLVIPNNKGAIKTAPELKGLKDFDPKASYPKYEGMKVMTSREKGIEMGKVSNLITDMTIRGASPNEIVRAVRHSMVVIDAEKHQLNYKQSYLDNGIAELKLKYQGGADKGASTLISRSSATIRVDKRKELTPDPITGEKRYEKTGETYINNKGKVVKKTQESTRMYETSDANTLSSGTPMEGIYASYANKLKALANDTRKEILYTPSIGYQSSAKKAYEKEVSSLNHKLSIALKNAPLERQAQLLANKVVSAKRKDNPNITAEDIKKLKGQALAEARNRVGAKKTRVNVTPQEWEAIQSGAISNSKLEQILNNTDLDVIKKYATPRTQTVMTDAKLQKAIAMKASGYTQSEIADSIGVSVSTINESLKEE